MIGQAEKFYKALKLPYNVVKIVSGALNDAAAMKYDLEAWFPGYNDYRELVSCSNCTDYQSRALGIRYALKNLDKGQSMPFVHLLNGTLSATERTLCCIMENYQTPTGVIVPEALRPFMGGTDFLPFDAKKLAAFTGADKADKEKGKGKGKKDAKKDTKPQEEKKSSDAAAKQTNPKLDALEKTLQKSQWVGGQQPTSADKDAFDDLKGNVPSADTHPALFAWFATVSRFSDATRNSWSAAAKKDDDDMDDLFGDDAEDSKPAKIVVKKKKKEVIAMSLVMLEVKPLDSDTVLDDLAKKCFNEITQDGLFWKTEFKKEPVAFGIFKLIIGFSCEDEKVSVDDIVERIEAFDDLVQSVEIMAFNKI